MHKTILSVYRAAVFSAAAMSLAVGALVATVKGTHAQTIAVVVHSDNPMTDISTRDLARIFLGQTNTFPGIGRILRFEHDAARQRFYERATSQSLSQVERLWNQLVFSGAASQAPDHSPSLSSILRSVGENPGAIAIVQAAEANAVIMRLASQGVFVKTLSVEGLNPTDENYPIF